MFLSAFSPRSWNCPSTFPSTCRYASSERQMPPGSASASSRAAIFSPSPITSSSGSLTTSPTWMATRKTTRWSSGAPGVALGHRVLDFNGAAHSLDHTRKLDERAVAGGLDDTTAMTCDRRIEKTGAQSPEPRKCPLLVGVSGASRSPPRPPRGWPPAFARSPAAPWAVSCAHAVKIIPAEGVASTSIGYARAK